MKPDRAEDFQNARYREEMGIVTMVDQHNIN